jgi:hypothetical protein
MTTSELSNMTYHSPGSRFQSPGGRDGSPEVFRYAVMCIKENVLLTGHNPRLHLVVRCQRDIPSHARLGGG